MYRGHPPTRPAGMLYLYNIMLEIDNSRPTGGGSGSDERRRKKTGAGGARSDTGIQAVLLPMLLFRWYFLRRG